MSDLAMIKYLDGYPAHFVRFEGADSLVIDANDRNHIVTRAHWQTLLAYRDAAPPAPSNLEGYVKKQIALRRGDEILPSIAVDGLTVPTCGQAYCRLEAVAVQIGGGPVHSYGAKL